MSPEDVLLETINEVKYNGATDELRQRRCRELNESILACMNFYAKTLMLAESQLEAEMDDEKQAGY